MTPARIRWNVSAAYTREQDGHSAARRLPHRTCSTPSGLVGRGERLESTSPVVASTVSQWPWRRTGLAQCPTREAASDHASKSRDSSRAMTCASVAASRWPRSSGWPSPRPDARWRAGGRRPRRGLVLPGSSTATPFPGPGGCAVQLMQPRAARHTRSGRAASKRSRRRCRRRGELRTRRPRQEITKKITKKMADQKRCVCV